ncbi:MAG: ATP-binding protein, partial [Gemmatimonadota bacterium]|nr:ATP-binding protein [Gemmatimonadota bacterium]
AAEATEAHVRSIFDQAPVAKAVLGGPQHAFEVANDSYRQLIGNRDVVGKGVREALPELEGQGVYELLDRTYSSGRPFLGKEIRIVVDATGQGVPEENFFNFVYQPMVDGGGRVQGIAVVVTNVSDLVRSREVAETARRAAEEANRAKSGFLAAMSHELRTPLNAIAGYAQLMLLGVHGPLTDAQRGALGRIERSEQHLLSLINDVLNFAKLEAGRVEYDIREVPLGEVVDDIASMVEPQVLAKGLSYDVDVERELILRADPEKVRQILLNLLSNAVKFTPAGGRISIGATVSGDDSVLIIVTDTGIGIPDEKKQRVFEPFVQVHRQLTPTTEGTGLGLAISRDLSSSMGGELTVESEVGQGSTFTLRLPLALP